MMSNWLTISQSAGTGNATITVNAQSNPGFEQRTARIIVSNGTISKTVSIVQESKTPHIDYLLISGPDYYTLPYSGGSITSGTVKSDLIIYAHYDNYPAGQGFVDVTSASTIGFDRAQVSVSCTTNIQIEMKDWFYVSASYSGISTSKTVWVYQEGVPETRRITYSGTSQILLTNSAAWHYNSSYVDDMNVLANSYNSTSGTGIVVFDKDAITIPYEAFKNNTGLTAVDIPSSVSGWSESSFKDCTNLVSINGLENVAQLGNYGTSPGMNGYQFLRCSSLTHVGLPASMPCPYGARSLTYMMFSGCTNLTTLIYAGTMDQFNSLSKHADWRTGSALRYIECSDGTIDLDPQNDTITYYATQQLNISDSATTPSFTSHTFSNGVGTIKAASDITEINASGFANCYYLTEIILPENVTTIGDFAFFNLYIKNIILPDNVTSIGNSAFRMCASLTGITIPNGVTIIGDNTFHLCQKLPEITIPSSVSYIGWHAFSNCLALSTINYSGTMAQWGNVTKDSDWHPQVPATVVHCTDGDVTL